MANLDLYDSWRTAPENALKPILAGNLKGKSDINPQWRLQVLTETFGPVGVGWYIKTVEHWTDTEIIDGATERVAWVRIELYICYKGNWSLPIEGIGGSKYAGKGRGSELNDEAFKMATTDAISVACKMLGIAADVYWDTTNTKYTQATNPSPKPKAAPKSDLTPITRKPEDADWVNWLVKHAAQGETREQCEAQVNTRKRTIPADLWDQIVTNL